MLRRVVVAIEGRPYADGRYIQAGALVCDDERVPVMFWTGEQCGWAKDLQRDEHEVTMMIELFEPYHLLNLDKWDANIFVQPYSVDPEAGMAHIDHARIREVNLTSNEEVVRPRTKESDE